MQPSMPKKFGTGTGGARSWQAPINCTGNWSIRLQPSRDEQPSLIGYMANLRITPLIQKTDADEVYRSLMSLSMAQLVR
jgi:hypothetical protein